jgi:RNA polymerase sigma factor (sigma-70 family)
MALTLTGGLLPTRDREGDAGLSNAAWGRHVARHGRAVILALLARGVPLDRAKDLAQAAWMRLWERECAGELPFVELPGLAIRQARLLLADERRTRRRQEELRIVDFSMPLMDPADRYLSRDQLRRLDREVARLPENARQVFRLVYGGEGLSHAQIALRLGLSVERVRHLICEARRKLRPLLEEDIEGRP